MLYQIESSGNKIKNFLDEIKNFFNLEDLIKKRGILEV
jgi:hypothetical protein